MHTPRWIFLVLLTGFIVFLSLRGFFAYPKRALCPRCNVLVITIDNLRADALPCYGYRLNTAPNICKFADQSVIFSRAHTTSSWTLPSEMSLFTGLYPTSHGMDIALQNILNPAINTIPKVLQAKGYETTAVSNIQANVGLEQGLGRGFTNVRLTQSPLPDTFPVFLKAIDAMKASNARHKPAFLFFHTDGVHDYLQTLPDVPASFPLDPTYVPPAMPKDVYTFTQHTKEILHDSLLYDVNVDPYLSLDPRYATWLTQLNNAKTLPEAKRVFDALPTQKQNEILWSSGNDRIRTVLGSSYASLSQHLYDEAIRTTDDYLGQIFKHLTDQNLLRNTIVIITAEHGEFLGERGLFGHYTQLFEPETHIPLIMYVPTIRPMQVNSLTSLIDIYPTIVDLVSPDTPKPKAGVSQVGIMTHAPDAVKRTFVIGEWSQGPSNKSIRTDRWHVLEVKTPQGNNHELYNVTDDPAELKNVAREHPDIVTSLTHILHTALDSQPVYRPIIKSFPDWIDETHRKNLIETGYF